MIEAFHTAGVKVIVGQWFNDSSFCCYRVSHRVADMTLAREYRYDVELHGWYRREPVSRGHRSLTIIIREFINTSISTTVVLNLTMILSTTTTLEKYRLVSLLIQLSKTILSSSVSKKQSANVFDLAQLRRINTFAGDLLPLSVSDSYTLTGSIAFKFNTSIIDSAVDDIANIMSRLKTKPYITQEVTFGNGELLTPAYTLAMIFSLAHPYGTPTILSGYSGFTNKDADPPNCGAGTCSGSGGTNGWLCQHR